MSGSSYPLAGITVLDLGQVYQGPYCGFLMAMAGARVIKIEPPGGESVRSRADAPGGNSLAFSMLNANKEGITLDFKSEDGKRLLLDLVEHADVLIENYAPGVMDRLGLGADTLRARNPKLIYASGSGYGTTGPYRDYLAMDLTVQAMGGLMSVTGFPDGPPVKAGAAVCDFLGGTHLYGAIVTALYERTRTGVGGRVETAMLDMCYHTLASNLSMTHIQGKLIPRTGNRHGGLSVVPYSVYPASDGYVAIICVKEAHWKSLLQMMDRSELADDPRFKGNAARARIIDEVDALVGEWTVRHTRDEIFELSQKYRFPAAPLRDLYELSEDPHLHARGALQHFDHPVLGPIVLAHSPLRFDAHPPLPLTRNPELGEHTESVMRDLLGLSELALQELRRDGAFGEAPAPTAAR